MGCRPWGRWELDTTERLHFHFLLSCIGEGNGNPLQCSCLVNKAEIDVFLELSCFFYDPPDVGNLISGSSAFSKTSWNIWKFMVHVLLKPSLENFKHYLVCEMSAIVR